MKKGFGYAIGVVLAVLLMVGCSSQTQPAQSDTGSTGGFFEEKFQKLSDGRTVMCLYKGDTGYGYAHSALSCDWDNAIVHPAK